MRRLALVVTVALLVTIGLGGCGGDPEPRPTPPPPPPPGAERDKVEIPKPGDKSAFIYTWRTAWDPALGEAPAKLLPSGEALPWELAGTEYLKTPGGLDGWGLEYFMKDRPDRLKVGAVEYRNAEAARRGYAETCLGLGFSEPLAPAETGTTRIVERAGSQPGASTVKTAFSTRVVDRYLFLFRRELDAKSELAPENAIPPGTTKAFLHAVLPPAKPEGK